MIIMRIYLTTKGGVSFNSGVSCALIEGIVDIAEQIKQRINPSDFYHSPRTSLVALKIRPIRGWSFIRSMNYATTNLP